MNGSGWAFERGVKKGIQIDLSKIIKPGLGGSPKTSLELAGNGRKSRNLLSVEVRG